MVVLHELAHAMTPGHGHDTVFCSKLVELVERCIAPEAGLLLAAAFGERGVHVKKTTV
jgi:putative metallohydrolase (TIGR04338 family)